VPALRRADDLDEGVLPLPRLPVQGGLLRVGHPVRSPDGREWEISTHRLRLPPWRQPGHDTWEDPFDGLLLTLAALPIFVAELPVALVRAAFTRTRYVDAWCRWPAEIRITWRTTRQQVAAVADHVERELVRGYANLDPPHAERITMTKPPGLENAD
jgi:hypothetical protein